MRTSQIHVSSGAHAHPCLVKKSAMLNGHGNSPKDPVLARDDNDDSEDDKEEDGGNVDAGAPGSNRARFLVEDRG